MRMRWGRSELGDWLSRKTVRGLACGLDLETLGATVTNLSQVDSVTADTRQTLLPGNHGVKLHQTADGVTLSGCTLQVELTVSTQDRRGILRPPLVVLGSGNGEEMWDDGR
jgi:hypothetical protein